MIVDDSNSNNTHIPTTPHLPGTSLIHSCNHTLESSSIHAIPRNCCPHCNEPITRLIAFIDNSHPTTITVTNDRIDLSPCIPFKYNSIYIEIVDISSEYYTSSHHLQPASKHTITTSNANPSTLETIRVMLDVPVGKIKMLFGKEGRVATVLGSCVDVHVGVMKKLYPSSDGNYRNGGMAWTWLIDTMKRVALWVVDLGMRVVAVGFQFLKTIVPIKLD